MVISMISKIYIYESDTLNPYVNLAIEKVLFNICEDDWLILYLWQNQNTVVIGRNQNPWAECQCALLNSEGGKIARRLSGGGAVFHDSGNLNYTFITSEQNYDLTTQTEIIKKACSHAGITTSISGRNDLLADGRKFSGNAFYNSNNKVYHHGTLLISTDIEKMQRYLTPDAKKLKSKGIKSVKSRVINLSELNSSLTTESMKEFLLKSLFDMYSLDLSYIEISNDNIVEKLTNEYSSWDYIYGKTLSFEYACENRFDWGNADLRLNIGKGKINNAQMFTDSMDWNLALNIQKAIIGCRLEYNDILSSLSKHVSAQVSQDISNLIMDRLS